MNIWVADFLPIKLIELLPAISLIVIGLVVEKYYVGRISIFANAIALATYFYRIPNLPLGLILYINIVTIIGIIAFVSYWMKIPLPKEYYFIGGIVSSVISGFLLLTYGL